MAVIYEAEGRASPLDERVRAAAAVDVGPLDAEAAEALLARVAAGAEAFDHGGALRIESAYDASAQRLELRFTGGISAMKLLEESSPDGRRLLEPGVATRLCVNIDPVRYELSVAVNDHLMNAASNHPQGGVPLHVDIHYDDEGETMQVTIVGSLFAAMYLLMLVYLQMTQSRYR